MSSIVACHFYFYFYYTPKYTGVCQGLQKCHQALGWWTSGQNDYRRSHQSCQSDSTGIRQRCPVLTLTHYPSSAAGWDCPDYFALHYVSCDVELTCKFCSVQKRNIMLKPDETKSIICDMQVSCNLKQIILHLNSLRVLILLYLIVLLTQCVFLQMADGAGLGDSGSVLDFMSMKNYPDMSLEMSMLNSLGDFSLNGCICVCCIHSIITQLSQ